MRFPGFCLETTTTTGTGSLTLAGAVSTYRTLNAGAGTSATFPYFVSDSARTEWEEGWGYLSDSTTLVRLVVVRSSNSGAAVNFSAGTKNVHIGIISAIAPFLPQPYGDFSDGDVQIASSTTEVLTRDMHYGSLTFAHATTSKIDTRGFWIYANVIDLSNLTTGGGIFCTGVDGTIYSGGDVGGVGGRGTNTRATSGVSGILGSPGSDGFDSIGFGGNGGDGGDGSEDGSLGGKSCRAPYRNLAALLSLGTLAGASGGTGSSVAHGTGGSGQGAPGIRICARTIILPTGTAVGVIKSTGGVGGQSYSTSADGNSGSGGGGGILLVCETLTGTCASFAQSIGGAGQTAGNATDGDGGSGGEVILYVAATDTWHTAGPTANSGVTAGTTSLTVA